MINRFSIDLFFIYKTINIYVFSKKLLKIITCKIPTYSIELCILVNLIIYKIGIALSNNFFMVCKKLYSKYEDNEIYLKWLKI